MSDPTEPDSRKCGKCRSFGPAGCWCCKLEGRTFHDTDASKCEHFVAAEPDSRRDEEFVAGLFIFRKVDGQWHFIGEPAKNLPLDKWYTLSIKPTRYRDHAFADALDRLTALEQKNERLKIRLIWTLNFLRADPEIGERVAELIAVYDEERERTPTGEATDDEAEA